MKPEDFAAICRKGPERRSGDKKEQERRSGAFWLETNPACMSVRGSIASTARVTLRSGSILGRASPLDKKHKVV